MSRQNTLRTFIIHPPIPSLHSGFRLGHILDADGILLWFSSQNRTSWYGNRMFLVRKPYGFGTENVKGRRLETDFGLFNQTLVHSLPNKFTGENQNSLSIYYRFRVLQPQWNNQIPCHSNKPLHTSQLANQVPASTCAESHKNRAETHIQHILKMRIFVPRQQAHDGRKRKNTDYRR